MACPLCGESEKHARSCMNRGVPLAPRMTLDDALRAIIDGQPNQVNWAVNYAKHALGMIERGATNRALHGQLLYVIGNLQSWRGEQARQAKAVIKQAIKQFGG